jgi:predicted DNA-binding transcriptional regulator AlpA
MSNTHTPERAGWRVSPWCRAVGISRSTYYELQNDRAPQAVIVGRMRIIRESPAAWLSRVGKPA